MTGQIELTKGRSAVVDDDVLAMLSAHPWHASFKRSGVYAQASIKNSDTLDNRRGNLRIVTPLENGRNRKSSSRFGFSGVRKSGGCRTAVISPNGTDVALGTYQTIQEAAAAFNAAAQAIYGEYARLNPVEFGTETLENIIYTKRAAIARLEREIAILRGEK